jgi:hypothetical protein
MNEPRKPGKLTPARLPLIRTKGEVCIGGAIAGRDGRPPGGAGPAAVDSFSCSVRNRERLMGFLLVKDRPHGIKFE